MASAIEENNGENAIEELLQVLASMNIKMPRLRI